jgi:pilus assembly protein CpaF
VKLGQRLRAANEPEPAVPAQAPAAPAPAAWQQAPAPAAPAAAAAPPAHSMPSLHATTAPPVKDEPSFDPMLQVKEKIHEQLLARLGVKLFDQNQSDAQLRVTVVDLITQLIAAENIPLTSDERHQLVSDLSDNVLGHGPIDRFLKDTAVSEIMVQGTTPIFVERSGKIIRTKDRFYSNDQLRRVIERIVSNVGRRIDESSPMVDARLADGSRVNAHRWRLMAHR